MSWRETWVRMFEPERFPPPPLGGLSSAWRYGLAVVGYVFILVGYAAMASFAQPATIDAGVPTPAPPGVTAAPAPAPSPAPTADTPADLGPLFPEDPELAGLLPPTWAVAADLVLGIAALGVVHLRRRWPLTIALSLSVLGLLSASSFVVAAWALMSLASRRHLNRTVIGVAAAIGASVATHLLPWASRLTVLSVLFPAVTVVGVALCGMYIGVRRDATAAIFQRAQNAESERQFAVLAERNRIAREMHDVVAHRISAVAMHAGVLAYRTNLTPEQTRDVARIIQENATASLTELRSVLNTLRGGQMDGLMPQAPQPTLVDLDGLFEHSRGLGQRVDATVTLDAASVPEVLGRHAYRIVQECLTNARKHAPESNVAVLVSGDPAHGVRLRVSNDITRIAGLDAAIPGAKLGLVGINERVQMLGGTLTIDDTSGRFIVEAKLPWPTRQGESS